MILLTGAAGFIGSNVLEELNNRGITDIICVDDLDDSKKCKNLTGKKFVDYLDCQELFLQRLPKLDAIIHLGAISNPGATNVREVIDNNFTQTKKLLRLLDQNSCPFVYASSASVYGDNATEFTEDNDCEKPQSPYALSKYMIDQYVRRLGLPAVGLRYFNVYGPGEAHKGEYASFAHKIFCATFTEKRIPLMQHPIKSIRRDFVYVKDAVDVTLHFVTNPGQGVYNVGRGVAEGFDDVLRVAALVVGPPIDVYELTYAAELPDTFKGRYQFYTCADTTKLKTVWHKPFVSLEDGMRDYWKKFRERRAWNVT